MSIIVDLFAGVGGAFIRIHMSTGRQPDATVNHAPMTAALVTANYATELPENIPAAISM